MAFELDSVVPWGRNLDEYRQMFLLSDSDMRKRIAGFGDGPACFNAEATRLGMNVTSYDPIYQFEIDYDVKILETDYEFQKNARKLLIIQKS